MIAPTLGDMFRSFGRIGILSFGGPAAQIALMHKVLVEEKGWLDERTFLNALSFTMLLPGPEAMQLATFAGWKLRGTSGGLLAGLLFVLPGAAVIALLATIYALFGDVPLVATLFIGIKAVIVVIVLEALIRVARKALSSPFYWAIAGLSFAAIFALHLPFPLIIAAAAALGYLAARSGPPAPPAPRVEGTLRTIAIWLSLWIAPILALWASGAAFLTDLALFFSRLAVVTFGGAYAVLAYMTQEVVMTKNWLTTAQMIDGLGLAETTPGPLILVTEFVGFIAGYAAGGMALAFAAALVTLWVTFVPCFLWIFAGAPYIERLTHMPRLSAALKAITAAVVGVILNLSLWFSAHVFFGNLGEFRMGPVQLIAPELSSLQILPSIIALGALVLMTIGKQSLERTLAFGATAALVSSWIL
jgi:chromate transporter